MPPIVRSLVLLVASVAIFASLADDALGKSSKGSKGRSITYYVSPTGNDSNSGRSLNRPFQTLQHAADLTNPGDTVYALNGDYTLPGEGATVLYIDRSGTDQKWIRYKAYPGQRPRILVNNHWGGITIAGASYIEIDGFTVEGNSQNVTLQYAIEEMNNLNNPITSGNGISVTNGDDDPLQFPHHITISNNHVLHCPGGGISTKHADCVTIERNRVHHNCFYSPYANSGITNYLNSNYDERRRGRMFIRHNTCYGNQNFVPHYYSNVDTPEERTITDGNGISIDDTRNEQTDLSDEPYRGRTYIQDNIIESNGGRGVLSYLSDKVIIRRNVLTNNAQSPSIDAEIEVNYSSDVLASQNTLSPGPGSVAVRQYESTNVSLQQQ